MKQKFFKRPGEVSFRIWMFLLGLEEFKRYQNKEKINNLLGKVTAFSKSELVETKATEEEKAALDFIAKELSARGAKLN